MAANKTLHTSIRVQGLYEGRTGHAHLIVFQGLAPSDQSADLVEYTRGSSRKLTIDADAAPEFIRNFPGLVRLDVWHEITDIPEWLQELYCEVNGVGGICRIDS